ncbi:MAG: hypothetical protein AAF384_16600 [Pseudomonadota bacterium]
MSEAEAIEALANISSVAGTYFSIFISLNFAYLTVAYLVGRALTRFQMIIITSIYLLSSSLMAFTTIIWSQAFMRIHRREETVFTGLAGIESIGWLPAMYVLFATVITASTYFMYDIRRRAKSAPPPGTR